MAIYGVGSKWEDNTEMKNEFFKKNKFIVGWDESNARDLYSFVCSLKAGDILYLKSNQPGSKTLKVKGIGIVTENLFQSLLSENIKNVQDIKTWKSLFINVKWVIRDDFEINIPEKEGKLTNIRAATCYEEFLPFVQKKIIEKLFEHCQ